MSANHSIGTRPSGAAAMSSQSTAFTPSRSYVASVRPDGPRAKNRAESPLSLWVNQTPGSLVATAISLDSLIRWSLRWNSTRPPGDGSVDGSASAAERTAAVRDTMLHDGPSTTGNHRDRRRRLVGRDHRSGGPGAGPRAPRRVRRLRAGTHAGTAAHCVPAHRRPAAGRGPRPDGAGEELAGV